MKEATGELNMTIVTLIAVAALGALFYWVIWPIIQKSIVNQTCGSDWTAVSQGELSDKTSGNAKVYDWFCCPEGAKTEADGCIGTSLSGNDNSDSGN